MNEKVFQNKCFSVLIFERLRVEEPCVFLTQNQIYADVYVEIDDNVLSGEIKEELFKFENAKLRKPFSFQKDIASKDICIDEALKKRLFKAYGDKEVWKFQLDALRKVLNSPQWTFPSRLIKEFQEEPIVDDDHSERIEYCKLPQMELHNIPSEFKNITEHFKSLRKKYVAKQF